MTMSTPLPPHLGQRPQTPARDALAHDAGALINLLLSSLTPPERSSLLTASRALGWDLERIADPVRGPLARLSESAACDLIFAAFVASDAFAYADTGLLVSQQPFGDLPAALTELRTKVLR